MSKYHYQDLILPSGLAITAMSESVIDEDWLKEMEITGQFNFGVLDDQVVVSVTDKMGAVVYLTLNHNGSYNPLSFSLPYDWSMSDTMEVDEQVGPLRELESGVNGGITGGVGGDEDDISHTSIDYTQEAASFQTNIYGDNDITYGGWIIFSNTSESTIHIDSSIVITLDPNMEICPTLEIWFQNITSVPPVPIGEDNSFIYVHIPEDYQWNQITLAAYYVIRDKISKFEFGLGVEMHPGDWVKFYRQGNDWYIHEEYPFKAYYRFSFGENNKAITINNGFQIHPTTGVITGTPLNECPDLGTFDILIENVIDEKVIDSLTVTLDHGIICPRFEWNLPDVITNQTTGRYIDQHHCGWPNGTVFNDLDIKSYISGGLPFDTKNADPYIFNTVDLLPNLSISHDGILSGRALIPSSELVNIGYLTATDSRGKTVPSQTIPIGPINEKFSLIDTLPGFAEQHHIPDDYFTPSGGNVDRAKLILGTTSKPLYNNYIKGGVTSLQNSLTDNVYFNIDRSTIPSGLRICVIVNNNTIYSFLPLTAQEKNSYVLQWDSQNRISRNSTIQFGYQWESDAQHTNIPAGSIKFMLGDLTETQVNEEWVPTPAIVTQMLPYGPYCAPMKFNREWKTNARLLHFTFAAPAIDPTSYKGYFEPLFFKMTGGMAPYSGFVWRQTEQDPVNIFPFRIVSTEAAKQNPSFFYLDGSYTGADIATFIEHVGNARTFNVTIKDAYGDEAGGLGKLTLNLTIEGGDVEPKYYVSSFFSLKDYPLIPWHTTLSPNVLLIKKSYDNGRTFQVLAYNEIPYINTLDGEVFRGFRLVDGNKTYGVLDGTVLQQTETQENLISKFKISFNDIVKNVQGNFYNPRVVGMPTWNQNDALEISFLRVGEEYQSNQLISLPRWGITTEHIWVDSNISIDTLTGNAANNTSNKTSIYYYGENGTGAVWPREGVIYNYSDTEENPNIYTVVIDGATHSLTKSGDVWTLYPNLATGYVIDSVDEEHQQITILTPRPALMIDENGFLKGTIIKPYAGSTSTNLRILIKFWGYQATFINDLNYDSDPESETEPSLATLTVTPIQQNTPLDVFIGATPEPEPEPEE